MPENTNLSYCTLYLVRHGETEWNTIRKIQGQLDSTLTEQGIKDAKALADKLKAINFDAIFSSDLARAAKTAAILILDRQLAIATSQALRERTFGKYDGYFGEDYQKDVADLLEEYEQLTVEKKWKFKFDKAYESDEDVVTRFITYLREISVGYLGKTVLVVTHGGNLRTFLTKLGFAAYGELTPGTFKNAGYIKVRSDGIDFFIDEAEGVDRSKGIKTKTL